MSGGEFFRAHRRRATPREFFPFDSRTYAFDRNRACHDSEKSLSRCIARRTSAPSLDRRIDLRGSIRSRRVCKWLERSRISRSQNSQSQNQNRLLSGAMS
jgi:hypothetical protein